VQASIKHFPENEQVVEAFGCQIKPSGAKALNGMIYVTKKFICFVGKKKFVFSSADIHNIASMDGEIIITATGKLKSYVIAEMECEVLVAEKILKRCVFGSTGDSPIHTAVKEKSYHMIEEILSENPNELLQYNLEEQTPLHKAIILNDLVACRLLIKYYQANPNIDINHQSGKQKLTVLHTACSLGKINVEILDTLLKFDRIDVNRTNTDENTALHYLCSKTQSIRCDEIVSSIISIGGDANAVNTAGETPLHRAVFNNSVRTILLDVLVKYGAHVNCQNKAKGDTPLHYATRMVRRDIVEKLIAAGAEITLKNSDGNCSLDVAFQLLEERGGLDERMKLVDIIKMFEDVIYLKNILGEVGLETYLKVFVKEQLYELDVITTLTQENLMAPPLNLKMGAAIKLIAEIQKRSEEDFDDGIRNIQNSKFSSSKHEDILALFSRKEKSQIDVESFSSELRLTENLMISFEELEFTEKLGSGASGQVLKGLYKGTEVAIKILTANNAETEKLEFTKELEIMLETQSPYLIKLLGASLDPLCIVMEFCERGSLYEYLQRTKDISWTTFFSMSTDMAEGLSALHDYEIIHRDFKSLNLLLTSDLRVKVCDFGLSRNTQSNLETFKKLKGTLAYCAPEIFNGGICTKASDVFSLGIVLWELLSTKLRYEYKQPYAEFDLVFDFQKIVQSARGLRPNIPVDAPKSLAEMYLACVSPDVNERPPIRQVADSLNNLKLSLEEGNDSFINEIGKYPKFTMVVESMPSQGFQGWGDVSSGGEEDSDSSSSEQGFKGWGDSPLPSPTPSKGRKSFSNKQKREKKLKRSKNRKRN
jgi:serine/threonine protein kinase/ankyrin repeat protein